MSRPHAAFDIEPDRDKELVRWIDYPQRVVLHRFLYATLCAGDGDAGVSVGRIDSQAASLMVIVSDNTHKVMRDLCRMGVAYRTGRRKTDWRYHLTRGTESRSKMLHWLRAFFHLFGVDPDRQDCNPVRFPPQTTPPPEYVYHVPK